MWGPTGLGQKCLLQLTVRLGNSKRRRRGQSRSCDHRTNRGQQWKPASPVTGKQGLGRYGDWPAPRQVELMSASDTHSKARTVGIPVLHLHKTFYHPIKLRLFPSVHLNDPIQLRLPFLKGRTRKGVIPFLV